MHYKQQRANRLKMLQKAQECQKQKKFNMLTEGVSFNDFDIRESDWGKARLAEGIDDNDLSLLEHFGDRVEKVLFENSYLLEGVENDKSNEVILSTQRVFDDFKKLLNNAAFRPKVGLVPPADADENAKKEFEEKLADAISKITYDNDGGYPEVQKALKEKSNNFVKMVLRICNMIKLFNTDPNSPNRFKYEEVINKDEIVVIRGMLKSALMARLAFPLIYHTLKAFYKSAGRIPNWSTIWEWLSGKFKNWFGSEESSSDSEKKSEEEPNT